MAIGIPAAQLAALRKGMAAKPRKPIDTAAVDLLAFHVKAQRLPTPDREYRFAAMAVGGTGAGVNTGPQIGLPIIGTMHPAPAGTGRGFCCSNHY